jgi:hypothetical protein
MMPLNAAVRRGYLAPAFGLVLITTMSACSSSSGSAPTPATSSVPATAAASAATSAAAAAGGGSASTVSAITANWNKFFNPATPNSERVRLLQNGADFSAAISSFAASPLASAVSSKVDSVTVNSATAASVKYDLTAAGTSVAKDASGTAVLQDGTWKVGDGVFCGLLSEAKSFGLSVPVPAVCKAG